MPMLSVADAVMRLVDVTIAPFVGVGIDTFDGATVSTFTTTCFSDSTLPALSDDAKRTVVTCETVNAPEYALADGGTTGVPSIVYSVEATPESASAATSATETGLLYHPPEQALPLQVMVVAGARTSTLICCVCTVSVLPAASHDR